MCQGCRSDVTNVYNERFLSCKEQRRRSGRYWFNHRRVWHVWFCSVWFHPWPYAQIQVSIQCASAEMNDDLLNWSFQWTCRPLLFRTLRETTLAAYVLTLAGMLSYTFTSKLEYIAVMFVTAGATGYVFALSQVCLSIAGLMFCFVLFWLRDFSKVFHDGLFARWFRIRRRAYLSRARSYLCWPFKCFSSNIRDFLHGTRRHSSERLRLDHMQQHVLCGPFRGSSGHSVNSSWIEETESKSSG